MSKPTQIRKQLHQAWYSWFFDRDPGLFYDDDNGGIGDVLGVEELAPSVRSNASGETVQSFATARSGASRVSRASSKASTKASTASTKASSASSGRRRRMGEALIGSI